MELLGTLVNGLCIIIGTFFGLFLTKIPERVKETVMSGIGLTVLIIGMKMGFASEEIVVILLSLLTGALIGEGLKLDEKLNHVGKWFENRFKKDDGNDSNISEGFVTASLIFVIGALAVVGALDSGLRNDHGILVTKGLIDGFISMVLTTTLGWGVGLSFIPVIIYEGAITLLASQIDNWIPQTHLDLYIEVMTATGGLLILAIGLNLLKITNIKVANLLPSLFTVGVILYLSEQFKSLFL